MKSRKTRAAATASDETRPVIPRTGQRTVIAEITACAIRPRLRHPRHRLRRMAGHAQQHGGDAAGAVAGLLGGADEMVAQWPNWGIKPHSSINYSLAFSISYHFSQEQTAHFIPTPRSRVDLCPLFSWEADDHRHSGERPVAASGIGYPGRAQTLVAIPFLVPRLRKRCARQPGQKSAPFFVPRRGAASHTPYRSAPSRQDHAPCIPLLFNGQTGNGAW
jgi:hypothetical protein